MKFTHITALFTILLALEASARPIGDEDASGDVTPRSRVSSLSSAGQTADTAAAAADTAAPQPVQWCTAAVCFQYPEGTPFSVTVNVDGTMKLLGMHGDSGNFTLNAHKVDIVPSTGHCPVDRGSLSGQDVGGAAAMAGSITFGNFVVHTDDSDSSGKIGASDSEGAVMGPQDDAFDTDSTTATGEVAADALEEEDAVVTGDVVVADGQEEAVATDFTVAASEVVADASAPTDLSGCGEPADIVAELQEADRA